jgi:hypothetical protein
LPSRDFIKDAVWTGLIARVEALMRQRFTRRHEERRPRVIVVRESENGEVLSVREMTDAQSEFVERDAEVDVRRPPRSTDVMVNIPQLPVDGEMPDLARVLMGDDRSSSAFSVFVDRSMMFCRQPLDLVANSWWGLFYERLRDLTEVVVALGVGAAVNSQQVPLEDGLLVRVDVRMFPTFYDAPSGNVPMPDGDEETVGDHSVVLLGFDLANVRFDFDHLFGLAWGRNGRGTLPFAYVAELTKYASVLRSHGGPAPPWRGADDDSRLGDKTAEPEQEGRRKRLCSA